MGERLAAIFCLGVILYSPLVIKLFDRGADTTVFGLPLLFFFFFASWALLIVLIGWAVEGRWDRHVRARRPRDGSNP
ncbi:MAG: hypothetical protein IPK66_10285 [Rhodospirillales bacterium]|nr:hypothetical protein [Rhodospirillales bacterium]